DTSSYRYGFYFQDEYTPFDFLSFNAGLRYDYYSLPGLSAINPRLAMIVKPRNDLALKLLYGTAFRVPELYELRYATQGSKPPTGLGPEHIKTYEVVAEYQPTNNLRLTATAFRYDINDLIRQVTDPTDGLLVFANSQSVQTQGLEFENEYRWGNGTRLRSSYAFAYAKDQDTGGWLINSPKHLAKLNLSTPLYSERLRAGIEWQFVSDRQSKVSNSPSYNVVNLTLTANQLIPNLDISGSIYNFLDKQYTNVPGQQTTVDLIPQDGRNFRLWFTYHF
ncbi:MAG TPA: TonB-dependent receptor, partial [Methylococcaceae bacterium]|nr:TonB-dependent receptor [Methylococcaceae bacterium]